MSTTMKKRSIAALAMALPLMVSTSCVSDPEDSPSDGNGADSVANNDGKDPAASADRGDRGGPKDAEIDGKPILEIGGVKTEATNSDTVELFTRPPLSEQAGESGNTEKPGEISLDWTSRLRLTFTSATREGDDVTFHGTASYQHDDGAYVIHSRDFTVLVPEEQAKGAGDAEFEDGFRAFNARESKALVTLTQDKPEQQFGVTIADLPEEDNSTRLANGLSGRYFQYETPEVIWGHELSPPQDFTPGRLCYSENDTWHDVELFEYTDIPCG
ncbi:hypothetical protein GCM10009799_30960 [Nocardiopsis rhodophaea]|uniref:Lipoprotein n=1 Tax=Nocardiopsis rhodophaea TaxID=280238 RepID=A0ABP5ELC3_9ACTN